MDQIHFNIQAGIFIQVQAPSAHRLGSEKTDQKVRKLTWDEEKMIEQLSGARQTSIGSGEVNHKTQDS